MVSTLLRTNEGVQGIKSSVLDYVRSKKIDKLDHYISSAKKHALLGPPTESIYGDLDDVTSLPIIRPGAFPEKPKQAKPANVKLGIVGTFRGRDRTPNNAFGFCD